MNSLGSANGAVKMMHAMNQAAGILHKNMSSTFRRCHGPQLPIIDKMALGGGVRGACDDGDDEGIGVSGDGLVNDSIVEILFIFDASLVEIFH